MKFKLGQFIKFKFQSRKGYDGTNPVILTGEVIKINPKTLKVKIPTALRFDKKLVRFEDVLDKEWSVE